MNNDLEQFSKNMLEKMAAGDIYPTVLEQAALARIALAAKQAKPVAYAVFAENGNVRIWSTDKRVTEDVGVSHPLYTTPQPAHTEQDGWINCSERMPDVGEAVLTSYQGATNLGLAEQLGAQRFFTSVVSGRELPADFWMPLPAAPKPESE
ncbi:hypothetical protein SRABI106_04436 [Rahnella aquatilis]|nr:hypothetical protein SRABI106_04436 [Rahnella aquatilis]